MCNWWTVSTPSPFSQIKFSSGGGGLHKVPQVWVQQFDPHLAPSCLYHSCDQAVNPSQTSMTPILDLIFLLPERKVVGQVMVVRPPAPPKKLLFFFPLNRNPASSVEALTTVFLSHGGFLIRDRRIESAGHLQVPNICENLFYRCDSAVNTGALCASLDMIHVTTESKRDKDRIN